jgi:hypothetical protein
MKDLAEAADEDKQAEESKVKDAVDALLGLYEDDDQTCYHLALLAIQITWWADPKIYYEIEEFGEQVAAWCQQIRDDEPNFSDESVLGEALEHLEMEAREAIAYCREQAERVQSRSRAGKWNDSFLHRDVPRPRVVPRSRRVVLELRQQREDGLGGMDTDGDADGSGSDEGDLQEDEEYDGMETDDFDGHENEDEDGEGEATDDGYYGYITYEDEYDSSEDGGADNAHVATPANDSEGGTDGKTSLAPVKEL